MSERDRDPEKLKGHWLLASLGKKVLRPGGRKLTEWMLDHAGIRGARVVEIAPGLGATAREILSRDPATYTGVDENEQAVAESSASIAALRGAGTASASIRQGRAQETRLPDGSTDLIVGEAMLSMQGKKSKHDILLEVSRVLTPGGRYAIHELALRPDSVSDDIKEEIRLALTRSIRANTRPLTQAEWTELFKRHGFRVEHVKMADMGLLRPSQMLDDEGLRGVLRIIRNMLRQPVARRRVLAMRSVFSKHKKHLAAISLVAVKEEPNPGEK